LGPNGGYLAAIILRAMTAELDESARAAPSLTCHYLRPPGAGELRVDVTVERSGRSLSTVSACIPGLTRRLNLALSGHVFFVGDGTAEWNRVGASHVGYGTVTPHHLQG